MRPAIARMASALCALALAAAPAQGMPEINASPLPRAERVIWAPAKTLATKGHDPVVAVDPQGNTTVVWSRGTWNSSILAIRRPAGAEWGRPVRIGTGRAPQVATDSAGNVTAVWLTDHDGTTTGVSAARRPVGHPWTKATHLSRDTAAPGYSEDSDEGSFGAGRIRLAVSPRGATTVVWDWGSYDREIPMRIQAVRRPRGGSWGRLAALTGPTDKYSPVVAMDRAGKATVVYGDVRSGDVLARVFVPGRGWKPPHIVSGVGLDWDARANPRGDALIVMAGFRRLLGMVRRSGAPWPESGGVPISPKADYAPPFSPALTATGVASVLMAHGQVEVVRRPVNGRWSAPVRLADARHGGSYPLLVVNARGDSLALWSEPGLKGRYRSAGGAWQPRINIVGTHAQAYEFDAAVGDDGGAVVVWQTGRNEVRVREMRTAAAATTARSR